MAAKEVLETEVCVIGGGPAGAVTALRLARLGHAVCLVERQAFPRRHIGESLPPSILPLLELLGLRDRVERAGFLRPRQAIVQWADDVPVEKSSGEPGFQVDRGRFDAILLEAAARAGARIIQPGLARRPVKDAADLWCVPVASPNGSVCVRARFLVDAVGKRSLLGGASSVQSPPMIAVYGYWRGHAVAGPETRVEAGRNHWYWGAPLPDGSFNATVFFDPESCPAKSRPGLEDAYRSLVDQSTLLRPCLSGRLIAPVQACDATSRCALEPIGAGWIKVGESAFSIDPLSSQGVQTAVRTALQAAVVVHTMLIMPQNAATAANFFRDQQRATVERNQRTAARYYAERAEFHPAPFWNKRASAARHAPETDVPPANVPPALNSRVRLADDVRIELTPVIEGDVVVLRPALVHRALDRPVAYLHGTAVEAFLSSLSQPQQASDLILHWSRLLPTFAAIEVLHWMWNHQVITHGPERECIVETCIDNCTLEGGISKSAVDKDRPENNFIVSASPPSLLGGSHDCHGQTVNHSLHRASSAGSSQEMLKSFLGRS
jgi:flavin-dependent dehydrogenase